MHRFRGGTGDPDPSLLRKSQKKGKVMKLRTPGKFGHTFANSRNPDEMATYEPSHQGFHCLLSCLFFYSNNYNMNQTRSLSELT